MQLRDYTQLCQQQRDQLSDLQLQAEQQRYAGDIASTLYLLLKADSEHMRGLALVLDDVPRAFMLLQRGPFLPDWAQPDAAIVTALQVDRRFQGRGLGRFCMRALPAEVHARWPDVRRLQLSVDPHNHAALAFYRMNGWTDTGKGYRARTGFEQQLTLVL